jgi:hypothetical protein
LSGSSVLSFSILTLQLEPYLVIKKFSSNVNPTGFSSHEPVGVKSSCGAPVALVLVPPTIITLPLAPNVGSYAI